MVHGGGTRVRRRAKRQQRHKRGAQARIIEKSAWQSDIMRSWRSSGISGVGVRRAAAKNKAAAYHGSGSVINIASSKRGENNGVAASWRKPRSIKESGGMA